MKCMLWILSVLLYVLPAKSLADETQTVEKADVIGYGSAPGGFCAAIAAAREGAAVILLEPTQHIGGLSTGGLSHCDSNQMRRETLMGLFDEWHTRIVKDYTDQGLPAPYDPKLKNQALWTFEPHVAMRVTKAMLKDAGVVMRTGRYLKSVTKDGARITSLQTKDGTFEARVFVDGTYEGDLMAAVGVDWAIGREGRSEFVESFAGKRYPKEKMNISGFDDAGNLLPLVTTSDAGPDDVGDQNIMTYSFRLCLTRDPEKLVPMPTPTNYDPSRFELARRAFKAGVLKIGLDLYPLPGGKLDGNNSIGGQLSLGLVGGCNTWHSAEEDGRAKIWAGHKQYTLELLHFLRTDSSVPPQVRENVSSLGLCKDEFAETDHFPPALYVRESRRMKGIYALSQEDIIDSPEKDDPIAISSFPIDSHDCQRVALKDGGVINEGTIFPVRVPGTRVGYAYHVPYRSVLPPAMQCNNLLVPVAVSSTHVAMSSLRIEGAWMAIGQGAGVAAALAAKQNIDVQDLPCPALRERLLAQGQILTLPPPPPVDKKAAATVPNFIPVESIRGIVLDDASAKLEGEWTHSTNFIPSIGSGYVVNGAREARGDGTATATFRFKVPNSGLYRVSMGYSSHETRARQVSVIISNCMNEVRLAADQTKPLPAGEHFQPIGTAELSAVVETIIQISNTDTTGFVIVDALQLVPMK